MVATSITMFEDETKEADILKEEILVDKIPTTKRNSTVYEFEDFNDESDASLDIENLVDKVPSVKEIGVVEAPKEKEAQVEKPLTFADEGAPEAPREEEG